MQHIKHIKYNKCNTCFYFCVYNCVWWNGCLCFNVFDKMSCTCKGFFKQDGVWLNGWCFLGELCFFQCVKIYKKNWHLRRLLWTRRSSSAFFLPTCGINNSDDSDDDDDGDDDDDDAVEVVDKEERVQPFSTRVCKISISGLHLPLLAWLAAHISKVTSAPYFWWWLAAHIWKVTSALYFWWWQSHTPLKLQIFLSPFLYIDTECWRDIFISTFGRLHVTVKIVPSANLKLVYYVWQ